MEKQKLHPFAKFATMSLVGALPLLGLGQVEAQQSAQPYVQPHRTAALVSGNEPLPANSYHNGTSRPLQPAMVRSNSSVVPPIITGTQLAVEPSRNEPAVQSQSHVLAPIGTGIRQVAATAAAAPATARPFSPAKMPIRTQGSGTRSLPAPAIQIPSNSVLTTPAFSPGSSTRSLPSAPVISGSLVNPEVPQSFNDYQPTIASPDYFNAPIDNGAVGGCSQCGGSCNNANGTCNLNGNPDINPDRVNCDYGTYGSVSAARRYAYGEFLYLTRDDGDIIASNFDPLGDFDFNSGSRFTIGTRPDMTQGTELSYFGTFDGIEEGSEFTDDQSRIDALLTTNGGLISNADLSSFFDASSQTQFKETDIQSIEFNKVRWGWDVLKSFVGIRYVYFEDNYALNSTSSFNRDAAGVLFAVPTETGLFRLDTKNNLFGGHIGAELFYDIGYRFSFSAVSKYGAYVNFNEVENFANNNGDIISDTEETSTNISSTYELQVLAHYQLRQTARLRVGYTGFYASGLATVSDNFNGVVGPFSGFNASDEDDAFIQGFSFGLEIYR